MESTSNFPVIQIEPPSAVSKKSSRPPSDHGCAGTAKFYVTIPIADVGVIVLEQVLTVEDSEETAG